MSTSTTMSSPYREMVMIPTEEYKEYRKQLLFNAGSSGNATMQKAFLGLAGESPVQKELTNSTGLSAMQKELYNIKEKYGDVLPDDQRLKLESEVIAKHTGFNKREHSEAAPPINTKEESEKRAWIKLALDDFGKTHKNRSKQLFNQLDLTYKTEPQWTVKGELLDEKGDIISGSNILDNISYVTAQRSGLRGPPKGFQRFTVLLRDANVPRHVFSNKGMQHVEQAESTTPMETSIGEESPPSSPLTNSREKKQSSFLIFE